jgi:hypothetical protein
MLELTRLILCTEKCGEINQIDVTLYVHVKVHMTQLLHDLHQID